MREISMIKPDEFEKVPHLFSGVTGFRSSEKVNSANEEGVCIVGHELHTMDDGKKIDLCWWLDTGWEVTCFDVSASKDQFPEGQDSFLAYLAEKGFYLKNVEVDTGYKWKYLGPVKDDEMYRIQYYDKAKVDFRL